MMEKITQVKVDMPGPEQKTLEAKKLKDACCDFEAILLSQVFQSMRADPLAEESNDPGKEMYESMMDQAVASDISRGNRGGLADVLYRQLSPMLPTKVGEQP